MKQWLKKAAALILSAMITFGGGIEVFADSPVSNDDGLYVCSEPIPADVTAYARDQFQHIDGGDMEALNFTQEEAENLRLAPGFIIQPYDAPVTSYYFMVLNGDDPIASMTVFELRNGGYSTAFSKDILADKLYNTPSSPEEPVRFFVSRDAYYAVLSDGSVEVVKYSPEHSESRVENQIETLSQMPQTYSENVVTVSENTVYDDTINLKQSRTWMYVNKEVPLIDNKGYYGDVTGEYKGTCWASATASILAYHDSSKTPDAWRQWTLDQQQKYNSGKDKDMYTGGIADCVRYVNAQTDFTTTSITGTPSWTELKSHISKKRPFYTRWATADGGTGHAMVVCGYRYDSDHLDDSMYQGVYVMDPNITVDYVRITPYTDEYTVSGEPHTMVKWQKYK